MKTSGPNLFPRKKFLHCVRFAFMLTHSERLALSKIADIEGGLSDAAVLRRLIRRAASDYGVWSTHDDPKISKLGESEVLMSN